MLEVEDHHLATSDVSDTMNFWNNRVNIYNKLCLIAQAILAAPASRRTLKGVFLCAVCLLLVAETEWPIKLLQMRACLKLNKKSIGEHRHQCLCVNFGTLTSMEMDCK